MLYFRNVNGTRTSKPMFPGVWPANTEVDSSSYTYKRRLQKENPKCIGPQLTIIDTTDVCLTFPPLVTLIRATWSSFFRTSNTRFCAYLKFIFEPTVCRFKHFLDVCIISWIHLSRVHVSWIHTPWIHSSWILASHVKDIIFKRRTKPSRSSPCFRQGAACIKTIGSILRSIFLDATASLAWPMVVSLNPYLGLMRTKLLKW